MASDFIGGGLPPSAAAHTDPTPVEPTTTATAAAATTATPAATHNEPPASNPGADDPTAGIAKDAGGKSSTAHIGSPVTEETEKKTVVGTVLESVFGKTERKAEEHETNTATVAPTTSDEQTTGSGAAGYLGAAAGTVAAGATAAATALGLNQGGPTAEEKGQETAASVEKSTAETGAAASAKAEEATGASTTESKKETTGESAKESKEEAKNEDGEVDDDKAKRIEDHKAATRENKDAIPTAGGEKLGEAHAGESKVIPDNPPKAADESTPGQPDKTTVDNTAKNASAATPSAAATSTTASTDDKPKKRLSILGKVKAKLHLDKKDKS